MLMITPLMIWSALTLIDSHACKAARIMPETQRRGKPDQQRQA